MRLNDLDYLSTDDQLKGNDDVQHFELMFFSNSPLLNYCHHFNKYNNHKDKLNLGKISLHLHLNPQQLQPTLLAPQVLSREYLLQPDDRWRFQYYYITQPQPHLP